MSWTGQNAREGQNWVGALLIKFLKSVFTFFVSLHVTGTLLKHLQGNLLDRATRLYDINVLGRNQGMFPT